MVNVGLIGPSKNKIILLKMIAEQNIIGEIARMDNKQRLSIVKTDFSENPYPKLDPNDKEGHTIHPNQVEILDEITAKKHAFLISGEEINRTIVRMGLVKIIRMSKRIVLMFDTEMDIETQLHFFQDARFLPKEVLMCVIAPNHEKFDKFSSNYARIQEYFQKYRVTISRFLGIISDGDSGITGLTRVFNYETIRLLLQIITEESA
jgi:hypothetical protein